VKIAAIDEHTSGTCTPLETINDPQNVKKKDALTIFQEEYNARQRPAPPVEWLMPVQSNLPGS
jgi:hypothetical protein